MESFNAQVRRIGEREKWLSEHDIKGWVNAASSLGAAATGSLPIAAVPVGMLVLQGLLRILEKKRTEHQLAGRLADVMTTVMTQQPPKAVLVSKLRRKLGELAATSQ